MEGCQHNTWTSSITARIRRWVSGIRRAAEEMARHVGDTQLAATCRDPETGQQVTDANLFNGQYYEHKIQPPTDELQIAAACW